MFDWLFNSKDDDSQDPIRKKILEDVERLKEGVLQSPPEMKIISPPACSMFFIKTKVGTFTNAQLKSVYSSGPFIELRFHDANYTFKCQKTKKTYDAIIKAIADAAAKLVPCVINEAPTPYGTFSYHENSYSRPTGEDLIVDIDAIVKKTRCDQQNDKSEADSLRQKNLQEKTLEELREDVKDISLPKSPYL